MKRPIKDVVGDVYRDGQVVHSGVRIMVDDTRRIAVFEGKTKNPPVAVYADGEVTYRITGTCSACKGFPPRATMWRIWQQADARV